MEISLNVSIVYIISLFSALYTAWAIGSNDVANAMATSVGSKALTIKKAIIVAAIFELSGSILVGARVTETIRSRIIEVELFNGKEWHFILGMLASLLATGLWIQIATTKGLPISTTHSIVGAVVGFGIISIGIAGIKWIVLIKIVLSWIISPVCGFILAFILFSFVRKVIIDTRDPIKQLNKWAPFFMFLCSFIILLSFVYKGLKNLYLDFPISIALPIALSFSLIFSIIFSYYLRNRYKHYGKSSLAEQYRIMESLFAYLQIMTACYMAFAHGANDVANSIGPLSAIVSVINNNTILMKTEVPLFVLLIGGIGIVIGLLTYGYKVIYI